MFFFADLHVHSKHSRATSKDADLEGLAAWAKRKGITVVGTGDFTHPAWFGEIRDRLEPDGSGLYRLEPELERAVDRRVPDACRRPVRFMLEVEISTIYKKGERTRKVHHLVYAAEMETAAAFRDALDRIGNIESDGRPILGLDSRDLLEIVLEAGPDAYLVPAHVWTPWFSVLGSRSGFDAVADCYGDLADHIFAVETGLSSDPPMNWRVPDLDRYRLVSNSDAHSPPKLGREACVFDTERDYAAMRRALETGEGYRGTVEFFPEEGKYHLDGHRKCGVRMKPAETRRRDGECPECGKPVTVGVMHRVEELAGREDGVHPDGREPFRSLVPLPEIVSEIRDVGVRTKTVGREVDALLRRLGPELPLLGEVPLEELESTADPRVAEAVRRLRAGDVRREAGYDGEYGVIRLFDPGELRRQTTLGGGFDRPQERDGREREASDQAREGAAEGGRGAAAGGAGGEPGSDAAEAAPSDSEPADAPEAIADDEGVDGGGCPRVRRILDGLDPDQRGAVRAGSGPLLVVAGPGTGKTRTLTHRIAARVAAGEVDPAACLTVTFTRRAAAEMRERLEALIPDDAGEIPVTTFHGLAHALLREHPESAGLPPDFRVADEHDARRVLADRFDLGDRAARRMLSRFGAERRRRARERLDLDEDAPGPNSDAPTADDAGGTADGRPDADDPAPSSGRLERYEAALRERGLVDFDGLVTRAGRLLDGDAELRSEVRERFRHVSVDEYQDVDPLQYRLVRLLAPRGSDLCAIGDPDQSIYGFRGAEVGFFLRFRRDYPSARTVHLERNYRSGPAIVDAARQAIAPDSLTTGPRLRAVRTEGAPDRVRLHAAPTAAAEAEFVVHTIERTVGGVSYFSLDSGRVDYEDDAGLDLSFSDFSVLYRTRHQAAPLVEALARSGIPFQRRSHARLRERPAVRRVVESLRALREKAGEDGEGADRGDRPVREWLRTAAERADATAAADDEDVFELLAPLAERHGRDLGGFLDELALGAEVDAWDPRADRVSLLTLHAAKGLEFPVVFVVGCEDGLLPLRRGDGDVDVAEERRLLFVGMTRARRRLVLSHARRRPGWGTESSGGPSPFLAEIEERLLERSHGRSEAGAGGAQAGEARAERDQLRLL